MGLIRRVAGSLIALTLIVCANAQTDPGAGAHLPAQAAADVLKSVAAADGAFIAAADINGTYQQNDLATLMQLPAQKIVVMKLTGADVRLAFQRSVSLYPQPNSSFLQISGFTVEFNASGNPANRIVSIKAGGESLVPGKTYNVAMPADLAAGGLGYFKIWDKTKVGRTLDLTLEDALSHKAFAQTSPRWVLR